MRLDRAHGSAQNANSEISMTFLRRRCTHCVTVIASLLLAWLAADLFIPGFHSGSLSALGSAAGAAEPAPATSEEQVAIPGVGALGRAASQMPARTGLDNSLTSPHGETNPAIDSSNRASEATSTTPIVAGQLSPGVDTGNRPASGTIQIEQAGTPFWVALTIVTALLISAILFAYTGWLIRHAFGHAAGNRWLNPRQTTSHAVMPEPFEPAEEILHRARVTILDLEQKLLSIERDLTELRGLLLGRAGIRSQDPETEQPPDDRERFNDQPNSDHREIGVGDPIPTLIADDDHAGGTAARDPERNLDETDEVSSSESIPSHRPRQGTDRSWDGPRHIGLAQLKSCLAAFEIGYKELLSEGIFAERDDWCIVRVWKPARSDSYFVEQINEHTQIKTVDSVFVAIVSDSDDSIILELYPCKETWKSAVPDGILIIIFFASNDLEQLSKVIEPAKLKATKFDAKNGRYELLSKGRLE